MTTVVRVAVLCLTMVIHFHKAALMESGPRDRSGNCQFFGSGSDADSQCSTSDIFKRFDREMKQSNDSSSATSSSESSGPPDSHEAMNNRQIPPKVREKRSYEFLMGLINNNSRYEVTRVDPELTTQKPKIVQEGVNASELLLELMVRIASHPDQWDRVHNLLQTIDQDLKTSKSVVNKLQALSNDSNDVQEKTDRNKIEKDYQTSTEINIKLGSTEKKWPVFDIEEKNVQIVNSNNYTTVNDNGTQNNSEKSKSKSNKSAYPKNFTYHRVTGKPDNTSKNPRAYIAVSVIAPKQQQQQHAKPSEEGAALENELHQLKPWSHVQNLKNMESLRSKWIVQHREENESAGKS